MRRPGTILAALLALTAPLAPAGPAWGAAGGGSGGFGGGGGGGGGFSGGGGGGFSGGGGTGTATGDPRVILVIFLFVVVMIVVSSLQQRAKRRRMAGMRDPAVAARRDAQTEEERRRRVEEVRGKSFVAAEDDPVFAADHVVPEAEALFRSVQAAWDSRDVPALRTMVGGDLMLEWERRLDDFARRGWHNRVTVEEPVRVEYVGITNRTGTEEDRVVVRISATVQDYVLARDGSVVTLDGMTSRTAAIREFWTLARRDGRWVLLSIEQELEGEHQLRAPIVAEPAADPRMADEAMVEVASEGRVDARRIAELADLDFEGSALTAARDMSLVDRRFDPNVIEVAARRVVAAWAEAVDGDDAALLAVADAAAVREMLHPGDPSERTRLVVRGPVVRAIRVESLDAAHVPARMVVSADIVGVRFIEDRDTTDVVAGDRENAQAFVQTWTLELTDAPDTPWRVVDTGAPAPR